MEKLFQHLRLVFLSCGGQWEDRLQGKFILSLLSIFFDIYTELVYAPAPTSQRFQFHTHTKLESTVFFFKERMAGNQAIKSDADAYKLFTRK
jgi:hypothetical protein